MKYLLIAFAFISCQVSPKKNTAKVSTEPLDTIKIFPAITAEPQLFEKAFIAGTTQEVMKSKLSLYGINIGKIKITSGRIMACDPIIVDEYGIPFTQTFPTGEFPVQLSIAKLGDAETVAFARINFSEAPVTRWELALLKGQKQVPLNAKEKPGYVVDGGFGSFMDAEGKKAVNTDQFQNDLYQSAAKHYRPNWKYAVHDYGKHNIISFTSGFGDGNYSTYVGYDTAGKPCRLLTNFEIFD